MDELAVYAAYLYFGGVVLSISYRWYGIFARAIFRYIFLNFTKISDEISHIYKKDTDTNPLEQKFSNMITDYNINEIEFEDFVIINIAYYVKEKDKFWEFLGRTDDIHYQEKLLVKRLLKYSLNNEYYRKYILDQIINSPTRCVFRLILSNFIIKNRILSYLEEIAMKIPDDREHINTNTLSIISGDLAAKMGLNEKINATKLMN